MPQIRIKYFTDAIERLTYIDGKSDWIDLRASEEVTLKAGEFCLIPLGVAMELPEGYEAHVVPRSSTFKNYGIIQTNSCGIIDGTYCGDDDMWRMPVYAVRDTVIHVNDRICQFRIFENQPKITFDEVESLKLMSGGYDLSVTITGRSFRDVAMFVAKRLSPLDGVLSTATHFVLKTYKEKGVLFVDGDVDERGQI